MAPVSSRKHRRRHFTPPPDLAHQQKLKHPKTPSRCGVWYAKLFGQELGITIDAEVIHKVTGVAPRSQTRILASKQARTLHNQPDSGPDPRGRKRVFTRQDTSAIADYTDDGTIPLDDRGKPWLNIAIAAGVTIPETYYFKPPGMRTVTTRTLQKACNQDEGLINAICEEERELTDNQATARTDWTEDQFKKRPHSKDWLDVGFCDEFHFGIGPQRTKRLKRRRGSKHRYKPQNVHRKKVTLKDVKVKAQEAEHLKLLNVFVIIGPKYKKIVPYEVPNTVGKMTTKVYTERILPSIIDDLQEQGLTLCQDADSAHTSRATIAWAKAHGLPLLTLPGVSPDLSILESIAHPVKRAFHAIRTVSDKAALARFNQVFIEELDQKAIQGMYKWYTKRLHECQRADGQMTRY